MKLKRREPIRFSSEDRGGGCRCRGMSDVVAAEVSVTQGGGGTGSRAAERDGWRSKASSRSSASTRADSAANSAATSPFDCLGSSCWPMATTVPPSQVGVELERFN